MLVNNVRDNQWLQDRAKSIWQKHFSDIKIGNHVFVRFGQKAYTRLGSIKFGVGQKHTHITITGVFKDLEIPEFVIDATLAHEISHYAHGFFSPHERAFHHPHQGGIIKKEMIRRGLGDVYLLNQKWLRKNWREYVKKKRGTTSRWRYAFRT